jgi:hypothetical protein
MHEVGKRIAGKDKHQERLYTLGKQQLNYIAITVAFCISDDCDF